MGSLVLFVHELDRSLWFYIDYQILKKTTVYDRYPLTKHNDLFNMLVSACYLSGLDLRSGY